MYILHLFNIVRVNPFMPEGKTFFIKLIRRVVTDIFTLLLMNTKLPSQSDIHTVSGMFSVISQYIFSLSMSGKFIIRIADGGEW